MHINDHIQIFETSPGLYCDRVWWGGEVREEIELSHEDAFPTAHWMLCEMIMMEG